MTGLRGDWAMAEELTDKPMRDGEGLPRDIAGLFILVAADRDRLIAKLEAMTAERDKFCKLNEELLDGVYKLLELS